MFKKTECAWKEYTNTVKRIIQTYCLEDVCEVGAGANPDLSLNFAAEQGLNYTLLDVDSKELDKAPEGYNKLVLDICTKKLTAQNLYDLVFSRMLAEHVKDGRKFHANVHQLLKPGGIAFHFFPTLWAPPYIINRIFPERLTWFVLDILAPRDRYRHGKFPAYYKWCRGPTRRQIHRFESLNFEILEYIGFYGNPYYYKKLPLLRIIDQKLTDYLIEHRVAHFSSFAYVTLIKK